MTADEMINFHVNECVTLIEKEVELKIVDGVYTISQLNELEFNKEEIKKLLLMFKPMQKELATYKKAFELIAEDTINNLCLDDDKEGITKYYLEKAERFQRRYKQ